MLTKIPHVKKVTAISNRPNPLRFDILAKNKNANKINKLG